MTPPVGQEQNGRDRRRIVAVAMEQPHARMGYFDLQALAAYSCCSVRWLRDRLVDRAYPLPHHRVEGKLLIKREDFDRWISRYRHDQPADELESVVNGVLEKVGRQ